MKQNGQLLALRLLLMCCGMAMSVGLYAQVDFRYYQSPVHKAVDSSRTCGCAVAGMLENFAGVPSELDAQAWEDALGGREDLATGLQILGGRGIRAKAWPEGQGAQPLVDGTVIKTGAAAQDIRQIKAWLDQGLKGVVVRYRAPLPVWNAVGARDPHLRMDAVMQVRAGKKVYPWKKALKKFPDLAAGLADSSLSLEARGLRSDWWEQAVLVVGYDSQQGFLVKHCRGTGWGMNGYAWVDFDYHRHLAIEAAVVLLAKPTSPPRSRQSKQPLRLRLKCLPEWLEGERHLQLSVWVAEGGVDQPWKSLRYVVEADGLAKPIVLKPLAFADAVDGGYGVYLPMAGLPERFRVRVLLDDGKEMEWRFEGVSWRHGDYGE